MTSVQQPQIATQEPVMLLLLQWTKALKSAPPPATPIQIATPIPPLNIQVGVQPIEMPEVIALRLASMPRAQKVFPAKQGMVQCSVYLLHNKC